MNKGGRFTAWFSETERRALETRAVSEQATLNYVFRKAIREYLGPDALKEAADNVMHVAGNRK